MSIEEVKKIFVNQIKLRAYEDKFVDRKEEREILQAGIDMGIALEKARAALIQVCDMNDYVLESEMIAKAKELLATFAGNDGKIDEKEFNDVVTVCRNAAKGRKNEVFCKKLVIEVLEKESAAVKTGFFSNWYTRVKQEVGMA